MALALAVIPQGMAANERGCEMDEWLERLRSEIEEATQGMGDADWSRAPQGRWNASQILEHLGRTYGATAKMLELSLDAGGAPQVRAAKFSEWLAQRIVVSLGIFPSGRTAPSFVAPQGESIGAEALQRTLAGLERMRVAIAAAEQRWGSRKPIAVHFLLGPMRPEQWRKFHYLHGHHHMRQLRERLGIKTG